VGDNSHYPTRAFSRMYTARSCDVLAIARDEACNNHHVRLTRSFASLMIEAKLLLLILNNEWDYKIRQSPLDDWSEKQHSGFLFLIDYVECVCSHRTHPIGFDGTASYRVLTD
jgi:hypothetical protein